MIDKNSADCYSWGAGCEGWHLVRDKALSVIEERMPPGTSETRHHHEDARQFFYVLRGHLEIESGGKLHVVESRQGLEIAPRETHRVSNPGRIDSEFLVISGPASHGDRVED